jgi:hypothetical protein
LVTTPVPNGKPLIAVEVDGSWHEQPLEIEKDAIKDELFRASNTPLLRIVAKGFTERSKKAEYVEDCIQPMASYIKDWLKIQESRECQEYRRLQFEAAVRYVNAGSPAGLTLEDYQSPADVKLTFNHFLGISEKYADMAIAETDAINYFARFLFDDCRAFASNISFSRSDDGTCVSATISRDDAEQTYTTKPVALRGVVDEHISVHVEKLVAMKRLERIVFPLWKP